MKGKSSLQGRAVYIVDGARTPFLKAKGVGPFSGSDLAVSAGRGLLMRQPFSPSALDEVIIGSAMPGPDEANIARIVALRLGCGDKVPAFTVMRNCASGLQALDNAQKQQVVDAQNVNAVDFPSSIYKGFTLDVIKEPFSPTVNRVKAVAKNPQGIILLQTPLSFTTAPQTLISNIKLIIDLNPNLKAE